MDGRFLDQLIIIIICVDFFKCLFNINIFSMNGPLNFPADSWSLVMSGLSLFLPPIFKIWF